MDLGGRADRNARHRRRIGRFGRRPGRHHRHHRRQPTAPLLVDLLGADAGRRPGADLPGSQRGGNGLHHRPRGHRPRHRRGPGAGRQAAGDPRPPWPPADNRLQGRARPDRNRRVRPDLPGRAAPVRRGPARDVGLRDRGRPGRRPLRPALHIRHHRRAQRRDAEPCQCHRRRTGRHKLRRADGQGRGAGLSAHGLGRRLPRLLRPVVGRRILRFLPGKRRHVAGGSAGNRPDLFHRPAPHLRNPAERRDVADGQCRSVETPIIRWLHRPGAARRGENPGRRAGRADRPATLSPGGRGHLRAVAQCAGVQPGAARLCRRRCHRAGRVSFLSRPGAEPETELFPHRGRRLRVPATRRHGAGGHGRRRGPRHRPAHRTRRRDPGSRRRHLPRLPQGPGRHRGRENRRWLVAQRRYRRAGPGRAIARHRPGRRYRTATRRHPVHAETHRDKAEILSLHQGSRGVRRWKGPCRLSAGYRHRRGRRLGRTQRRGVLRASGTGRTRRGL